MIFAIKENPDLCIKVFRFVYYTVVVLGFLISFL